MSSLKGQNKKGTLKLGGLPQVNLLPNDVRVARNLQRTKIYLLVAALLVVLAIAGAYVLSAMDADRAMEDFTGEQSRTTELQTEQRKYSEVPQVLARLNATSGALAVGSATEVLWAPYLDAITAVTPEEVEVHNLAIQSTSLIDGELQPADDVEGFNTARVTFDGLSETRPDTAQWIDELHKIPGVADARLFSSVSSGSGEDIVYETVLTVSLTDDALALRFPAEVTD